MDFGLSEEQQLLKETIRRFLADRCPPARVREIMESSSGHDEDLWRGLGELGVGALIVPEEHGGLGRELLDLALIAEELGYAAAPGPFLANAMATVALVEAAGEGAEADHAAAAARPGRKAEGAETGHAGEGGKTARAGDRTGVGEAAGLLERLAAGAAIATVAIAEDDGLWSPDALQARVDETGGLTATKPLVPYAAQADIILVAARDRTGPGLWLIEREGDGVEIEALQGNDMTRRLDALTVCGTPATRIAGASALARAIDAGLVLLAADAFGGASRCLEMTRSYALEREQFGQVIGGFQAVKHQLADMAAEVEPALSFYWYAAHAFDHIQADSSRHAAMAKAYLGELFDRIARQAIELHGGVGFTWEFDLHLWFRRSIFDRSYLGEAAYHRARAADLAGW